MNNTHTACTHPKTPTARKACRKATHNALINAWLIAENEWLGRNGLAARIVTAKASPRVGKVSPIAPSSTWGNVTGEGWGPIR